MAQAPQRVNLSPQQQADLASLMYELSQGDTRKDLAKLVKKKFPERAAKSFRDVEHEEQLDARFAEIEDKVDLKGAKAAKARQDEQRTKLAERYSEDHMKGIDAVAAELGISDLDSAAIIYAHRNPDSDPTVTPSRRPDPKDSTWEFPTVEGKDGKQMPFKEFASDLKKASWDAAYRTIDQLNDFKGRNLPSAFRR